MNAIKRARLIAGLTQAELAQKLGVSNVSVHKWESGKALPNVRRLPDVACALNTTVEKLIDEGRRAI